MTVSSEPSSFLLRDGRRVDLIAGQVLGRGDDAHLTSAELRLLRYLAAREGQDVSREDLLADVWGYASAVRSRTLDTTVGRLRQKIEADPARPMHLLTVTGLGYRLVGPPTAPGGNLPAPIKPLLGRDEELRWLDQAPGRLLLIAGLGGMGKSTLALHWARTRGQGRCWWIPLVEVRSKPDLDQCIAQRLGLRLGQNPALGRALEPLGELLLILDAAEHCAELVLEEARSWTQQAPALRVLITSRKRLRAPDLACLALGPLRPEESALLLKQRSLASGVRLDEDALSGLLPLLEGWPLAVELAGAALELRSPQQLVCTLSQRQPALALEELPTLHTILGQSWEGLDPLAQRALRRLCVAPVGLEPGMAEALLRPLCADPHSVLRHLSERSLVQHRCHAEGSELLILDAVRHFVSDRGPQDPDDTASFAQVLIDSVRALLPLRRGPGGAAVDRRLQRQVPNLLRVVRAYPPQHALPALLLLEQLHPEYWSGEQHLALLAAGLQSAPQGSWERARLLIAYASRLFQAAQEQPARQAAQEAVASARALGDPALLAEALRVWVNLLVMDPSYAARRDEALREALALAQAAGDPELWRRVRVMEGRVLQETGHEARALALWRDLARECEADGDLLTLAIALANEGTVTMVSCQNSQARHLLTRALHAVREVGALDRELLIRANLSLLHQELGQPAQALSMAEEATRLLPWVPNMRASLLLAVSRFEALLALDRLDEAELVLSNYRDVLGDQRMDWAQGVQRTLAARLHLHRGQALEAQLSAEAALTWLEAPEVPSRARVGALALLVAALADQDQIDLAREHLARAQELARDRWSQGELLTEGHLLLAQRRAAPASERAARERALQDWVDQMCLRMDHGEQGRAHGWLALVALRRAAQREGLTLTLRGPRP